MKKNLILFISFLLLANCGSVRDNTPLLVGGTNVGMMCAGIVSDPAVIAACATAGAIVAVDQVWNDDFNEHKKYFVDHLLGAPNKPNITNWYNPNTKNSGIIKTTRTFYRGPLKCRSYQSTIDITPSWPVNFAGSPIRETTFGVACILPDGRVEIQSEESW